MSDRQHLGRVFRAGRPKLVFNAPSIEQQIADRLRARLQITDETILLKNGQVIVFPQSEGVGRSLHPEGLTNLKRLVRWVHGKKTINDKTI